MVCEVCPAGASERTRLKGAKVKISGADLAGRFRKEFYRQWVYFLVEGCRPRRLQLSRGMLVMVRFTPKWVSLFHITVIGISSRSGISDQILMMLRFIKTPVDVGVAATLQMTPTVRPTHVYLFYSLESIL